MQLHAPKEKGIQDFQMGRQPYHQTLHLHSKGWSWTSNPKARSLLSQLYYFKAVSMTLPKMQSCGHGEGHQRGHGVGVRWSMEGTKMRGTSNNNVMLQWMGYWCGDIDWWWLPDWERGGRDGGKGSGWHNSDVFERDHVILVVYWILSRQTN